MKRIVYLLSAAIVVSCLLGCKQETSLPDAQVADNALSIQSPDGVRATVIPIGSAFQRGSVVVPNEEGKTYSGIYYEFFREQYSEFPGGVEKPFVEVKGRKYNDVQYSEPGQWVTGIVLRELDDVLKMGGVISIPLEQGKYRGGMDAIKNVRINACKSSSFDIVITTSSDCVITLRYSGQVLFDPRM